MKLNKIIQSITLLLIIALAGCQTSSMAPRFINSEEIKNIETANLVFTNTVDEFQIQSKRPSLGGFGIIGAIESIVSEEMAEKAKTEQDRFASEGFIRDLNEFIEQDFLNMMKITKTQNTDIIIKLSVEYCGYRFDQMKNVKYNPSYILNIEVEKSGTLVYQHRIGSGNLYLLGKLQRIGSRGDLGYKKVEDIFLDSPNSIESLKKVISQVHLELAKSWSK